MSSLIDDAAFDPCNGEIDVDAALHDGVQKFADAWHAQIFGTTVALSRAGLFTWAKWVDTFSAEIRANPQTAEETSEQAYYRQWLDALQRIVVASARVSSDEIVETMEHWRRSFLATPHGKPIVFRRDLPDLPQMDGANHQRSNHDPHHDHKVLRPLVVSVAKDGRQ